MLSIITSHSHFGKIAAATMAKLDEAVRETAQDVRAAAAAGAPVDTTALQHSIYVSDDRGSDYNRAAGVAIRLRHSGNRPGSPAQVVPEVRPSHPHEAIVGSAVAHAAPNELGTTKMPARPFLAPAIAHAAGHFERRIEGALK